MDIFCFFGTKFYIHLLLITHNEIYLFNEITISFDVTKMISD